MTAADNRAAALSESQELDALASRLNRCGISRVDPESFHIERNDIVRQMRRLAVRLAGGREAEPRKSFAERRAAMAADLRPATRR